jgi:hypothetical protein
MDVPSMVSMLVPSMLWCIAALVKPSEASRRAEGPELADRALKRQSLNLPGRSFDSGRAVAQIDATVFNKTQ